VIDKINALSGTSVKAQINETGDGIELVDQGGGGQTVEVKDLANGTTAAGLKLAGKGVAKNVNNVSSQVIDGSSQFTIDLSTLGDPGANIALSTLNGGSRRGARVV